MVSPDSVGGTVGVPFSYNISATNSPTGYASTALPGGLSLNGATGEISGTPTTAGVFTLVILAGNDCGEDEADLTITIGGCSVPVVTASNRNLVLDQVAGSYTISASESPTSYSASGLPTGMSLNTSTGAISGTPSAAGSFSVTLNATNACGAGTPVNVTWTVIECVAPTLLCDSIAYTLTKTGFPENVGYESTPPKIYRTRTLSGTIVEQEWSGPGCAGTYIGSNTTEYTGSCVWDLYGGITSNTLSIHPFGLGPSPIACGDGFVAPCDGNAGCTETVNATTFQKTGSNTCAGSSPSFLYTSDAYDTLSNEYTTSDLETAVQSALAGSFPGTWVGGCESFIETDPDELTCSGERVKYKFTFDATGLATYRIDWMEGATAKYYEWDGVATETPEYVIPGPYFGSPAGVTDVVVTCT